MVVDNSFDGPPIGSDFAKGNLQVVALEVHGNQAGGQRTTGDLDGLATHGQAEVLWNRPQAVGGDLVGGKRNGLRSGIERIALA